MYVNKSPQPATTAPKASRRKNICLAIVHFFAEDVWINIAFIDQSIFTAIGVYLGAMAAKYLDFLEGTDDGKSSSWTKLGSFLILIALYLTLRLLISKLTRISIKKCCMTQPRQQHIVICAICRQQTCICVMDGQLLEEEE